MIEITPLHDKLVIQLRPLPDMTGVLHRVDRNELVRQADVIAVGPDVREVSAGDAVLVNVVAGQQLGGQLVIPESAILAHLDA